jgi:hypothetical protein
VKAGDNGHKTQREANRSTEDEEMMLLTAANKQRKQSKGMLGKMGP